MVAGGWARSAIPPDSGVVWFDPGRGRGPNDGSCDFFRDPAGVVLSLPSDRWSLAALAPPATIRAASGGV